MKKNRGSGGSNWMDTYGDMVTLLLCFFVLLYSMSTFDKKKWEIIVQSLNPGAVATIGANSSGNKDHMGDSDINYPIGPTGDQDITGGDGMPFTTDEQIQESIHDLYVALQKYVEDEELENSVSMTQGDGYVFLSFRDTVFFDGDSAVLRPEGKKVLLDIVPYINKSTGAIDELRILGHTAQANMDRPNNMETDRVLSSQRAAIVGAFIQANSDLDGARILTVGYGQWRPVDTNDTAEGKAHNRRVEMIVAGKNLKSGIGDSLQIYPSGLE